MAKTVDKMEINKNKEAINRILKGANKALVTTISSGYQFIDFNTLKVTLKSKELSTTFYVTRNDLKDIKKITRKVVNEYKNTNIENDVLEKATIMVKLFKDYFEIFDFLLEHDKDKTITEIKNDFIFKMGNKVYEYLQEI
ncbi:MAG: hypothetical protein QXU98_10540 [Candidatus Parvarchaeota archaeon]